MRDNQYLIHLILTGGQVRAVPNKHLGEDIFALYREACRVGGALYQDRTGYTCSINDVHNLIDSLRKFGFQPNVSPQLFNAISKKNPLKSTKAATDWIKEIQSRLAKNNLQLRKYQEDAVRILRTNKDFLLLDRMGVGKTPQSLCAIPDNAAVLIVCPAVAKDAVWAQDFEKFRPEFKRTILYGYHSFRWPKNGEVVITNYTILPEGSQIPKYEPWGIKADRSMRIVAHRCYDIKTQELITVPYEISPPNNLVIIADEIQNLMNLSTQRTRAFRALMNAAKKVDGYRWGLTGTELDSNPLQLWNLLQIFGLEKQAFISWSNFMRIFGGTQTGFGTKKGSDGKVKRGYGRSIEWRVPGPNDPPNKEAIEGLRRVSIKRRLEDVMSEVPPMTVKDVHVKVDEKTLRQCEKAVEELREKGLSIDQAIDICMKTANGGIPFKELAKANKMLAVAKTPIVVDFIKDYEDAKEPILVFSMNVEPLETLAKLPGWRIITGKTSAKERKQIVEDFQSGKFDKLGLSIMAAGLALNLDRAAFCFAINFAYTPAANNQAWYRIRRFTQRRPQFVYRFIANHALDERKIELLDAREAIIEKTTEAAAVKGTPDHLLGEQAGIVGHGVLVTDPRTYQIRAQSKRYHPRNPKEEWIAKAMREMARRDSDRATVQNARGFSKTDSGIGLNIVGQLKMGLTEKQWLTCERILKRYEGQIGTFEKSKL